MLLHHVEQLVAHEHRPAGRALRLGVLRQVNRLVDGDGVLARQPEQLPEERAMQHTGVIKDGIGVPLAQHRLHIVGHDYTFRHLCPL